MQEVMGMPGKQEKTCKLVICIWEKPWALCREGMVGKAEVRRIPCEDALCGDIQLFRELLRRENGMQKEFPCSVTASLAHVASCFPPLMMSLPLLLLGFKAVLGQRDVRMLVLLIKEISCPVLPVPTRGFLPHQPWGLVGMGTWVGRGHSIAGPAPRCCNEQGGRHTSASKRRGISLFRQWVVNNIHALLSHTRAFKPAVYVFGDTEKM